MNIIGISGLAGSGKDTVASILLENKDTVKIAFADPIKRFLKELWDFSNDQLFGSSEHRIKPDQRYKTNNNEYLTSRLALQTIGSAGRELDQDVWARYGVEIAKKLLTTKTTYCYSFDYGLQNYWDDNNDYDIETITGFPKKVSAVIISDARFINELKYIKDSGGILIRVVRPGSGLQGDFGKHQSETEMATIPDSEFDYIIQNDGTIEDLRIKVNEIYAKIIQNP